MAMHKHKKVFRHFKESMSRHLNCEQDGYFLLYLPYLFDTSSYKCAIIFVVPMKICIKMSWVVNLQFRKQQKELEISAKASLTLFLEL